MICFLLHRKKYNPLLLQCSPLSHLTSCTPTKSNSYLANSLSTVVSEPDLYRLLTFRVPNVTSLFHCLGRTKQSVQAQGTYIRFVQKPIFYGDELLTPCPIPKLEDHHLSSVRNWLFNIFPAILHIGGRSSIGNLRTRHAVVTGTHLSWNVTHSQLHTF